MDDEMSYWEEADKLNKRIYEAMQELKNARPALAGCDEVFLSISEKILNQFENQYQLLEAKYEGEVTRELLLRKERNAIIIPRSWKTKWLRRRRQNQAADLLDMEVDGIVKKEFDALAEQIIKKYYAQEQEEEIGEWEIVEADAGESAESAESPQNAPKSEKTVEDKQDSAAEALPAEGEIKGKKKGKKGKKEGNKNVREGDQT